jgi:hypothetical protein
MALAGAMPLMKVRKLRCGLSFWLGLLALLVSGLAQNDLSRNVIEVALAASPQNGGGHSHDHSSGGHFMPDGTWMAGGMGGAAHNDGYTDPAKNGGHSHKGHADCVLCGPLAAMASFTSPPPILLKLPEVRVITVYRSGESKFLLAAPRAPYASRAPPLI